MHNVVGILQVVAALGLLNVWLLRFNKRTAYRGGKAGTMAEEFAAYGLPAGSSYVIGFLKISIALCFIAGLVWPFLVLPASVLLTFLMLGALAMHWRVKDPATKYAPAAGMLLLSVIITVAQLRSV